MYLWTHLLQIVSFRFIMWYLAIEWYWWLGMGRLIAAQRVARYCETYFSSSPFLWNRKSLDPSYIWFSVSVVIFSFYFWPLNKEPRYQETLLLFHAWVEWASVSSNPGTMTYDDVHSFPIFCVSLRGRRSWPWTLCAFSDCFTCITQGPLCSWSRLGTSCFLEPTLPERNI